MADPLPNLRHLAAFVAIVEHGSATRAAEAVHLTQPALTQAISRLERDMGCQLFEREPTGMKPTEPAVLLAKRVRRAIAWIGSNRVTAAQVRSFRALARHGSYSVASDQIGLAPASLHRAVSDLSSTLGERLVERRGRHLALSRSGEKRAKAFGLALAELRSGFSEVSAWLGQAGGRIVIGAMPLSRARWLPSTLVTFMQSNPGIELEIVEGSYSELVGPLRNGDIDFLLGALRDNADTDDLINIPAFVDRPQIIMRAGHPLARVSCPSPAQWEGFDWMVPAAPTPLRSYWSEMMQASGCEGRVGLECGSVLTIRELLLETDMLTLLSPDQLRVEIEAGLLLAAPPPSPVERAIGIIHRRDWHPTPSQAKLLETLGDKSKLVS